jgi:hypothetical protein
VVTRGQPLNRAGPKWLVRLFGRLRFQAGTLRPGPPWRDKRFFSVIFVVAFAVGKIYRYGSLNHQNSIGPLID